MPLSPQAIEAFKAIYQEEFHESLSDAEAQEMGLRLLRLMDVLARPLPRADRDDPPRSASPPH